LGTKRYAILWIDPIKLASYGLTVAEVRTALGKQNVITFKIDGANTDWVETYLQQPKNLIISSFFLKEKDCTFK
jgi:HAE1 family hydrophobic/amphiphilic exporter-1/multidrug efflux pump